MALKVMAQSSTVRAIGPKASIDQPPAKTPKRLINPQVGRSPTMPHQDAGERIDPPVSSPKAVAHRRAAAAAADPLLEPPVERSRFHGFRAAGKASAEHPRARELPHVQLAENDRAARLQLGYHRRVFRRDVAL